MSRAKNEQLAAVSIGFQVVLLPMVDAAKVIALLSKAVPVDESFDDGHRYTISERPLELEYKLVRPTQVRTAGAGVSRPPIALLPGGKR